jgi:hypothetical protein
LKTQAAGHRLISENRLCGGGRPASKLDKTKDLVFVFIDWKKKKKLAR